MPSIQNVLRPAALLGFALLAIPAFAQNDSHSHHGDHAAHDPSGAPTGLSADAVQQLLAGAGMGLARPAEVHAYPGPLHVLELADALDLTDDQRATATRLREAMLARAMPLGHEIIAAERQLDALFMSGEASAEAVEAQTARIAALQGRLRAVHLTTHLEMRDAMTDAQVETYMRLRGHR